jgi:hypothetical protein
MHSGKKLGPTAPLANKATRYVSRLEKTNGAGSPSPWHPAMVCLLASLWCLGVLNSSIIACKLDWL